MEGIECLLLDIEGTICPISFVKDTLFPYALKALPDVLKTKWDDEEFKQYRDAFPEDAKSSPDALQAHVEDLTKRDVKIAYLKNLQGYLWEHGYESGEYATPLFVDVAPRLKQWRDWEYELAIYSSGSVFAQKLLFGHVKATTAGAGTKRGHDDVVVGGEESDVEPPAKKLATDESAEATGTPEDANGAPKEKAAFKDKAQAPKQNSSMEDLQYLISNWFDTTNAGPKTDASSYTKIADAIGISPYQILFLSDNVKEIDAAREARMAAYLVDRPGNAPISTEDLGRLDMVHSLDEVYLTDPNEDEEPIPQSPD